MLNSVTQCNNSCQPVLSRLFTRFIPVFLQIEKVGEAWKTSSLIWEIERSYHVTQPVPVSCWPSVMALESSLVPRRISHLPPAARCHQIVTGFPHVIPLCRQHWTFSEFYETFQFCTIFDVECDGDIHFLQTFVFGTFQWVSDRGLWGCTPPPILVHHG